jgi:hypothetical protein
MREGISRRPWSASPDVNAVGAFDGKHEIGKAFHFSAPQSGKGKLLRVARRPEARTVGDRPISGLKRLDETERDVGARLAEVMVDGSFDIPMGQLAREERLPAHFALACRTRSMRPLK